MDSFYKTTEAPLEPEELKKLKKGIYIIPFFLVFVAIFFSFILDFTADFEGAFYPVVGFMSLFGIVLFFIIKAYVLDLRDQKKEIFQGVITWKTFRRSKKSKGKGSSTSYYFYFGEKEMKVPLHIYGKFEEADLIEIHRSKRITNLIYKSELIKRGVMIDKVKEVKQVQVKKQQRMVLIVLIIFFSIVVAVLMAAHLGLFD